MTPAPACDVRDRDCDVVVIGGGPGGAIAARELARSGHDVVLLEKATGPRFHVGESLLPRTASELAEIGLLDRMKALPHVVKRGATFVAGAGTAPAQHLAFANALDGDTTETFNIEREIFDTELLTAAAESGVKVTMGTRVRAVTSLAPGDVRLAIESNDGTQEPSEISAAAVIDASGHGTVIGRHQGTRTTLDGHERVAYFSHLTNVALPDGDPAGYGIIVMFDEGWFWIIPIDGERTSVGVVLPAGLAAEAGVAAHDVLRWAIPRCPEMVKRCVDAEIPNRNHVVANFSYTCRPYAGPGWMLVGDAAGFMDPIFSGGVSLAILNGRWAAKSIDTCLHDPSQWANETRAYDRRVEASLSTLFQMIENYYEPAYRDLLHHGTGPLNVHRAAIELLSGRAFPRPRLAVAWRMRLMKLFQRIQRRRAIVPRMPRWSMREAMTLEVGDAAGAAEAAVASHERAPASRRNPAVPVELAG